MCRPPHTVAPTQQHWLLAVRNTVHCVPATVHVAFDRSIIRLVPSVCTAGICFITFWIYKDEN